MWTTLCLYPTAALGDAVDCGDQNNQRRSYAAAARLLYSQSSQDPATMTVTAVPALPPSDTVELDSVEGLVQFKIAVTIAILVITVLSSLAPLWISQNGTSRAQKLLTKKLPFMTAGVFIGASHILGSSWSAYVRLNKTALICF
jgi:hypothetical protein